MYGYTRIILLGGSFRNVRFGSATLETLKCTNLKSPGLVPRHCDDAFLDSFILNCFSSTGSQIS
jgi:hypothetical protein